MLNQYNILTGGDMAGSITSPALVTNNNVALAIQAIMTGSPVGTLKLQITSDGTNWTDYTGSSTSISAAGNFVWNILTIGFLQVRVVYTFTSGTGVLNIKASGRVQ